MFKKVLLSILAVFVIGVGGRIAWVEVLNPCARLDRMCARATQSGNLDAWGVCVAATFAGARNSYSKCQKALDLADEGITKSAKK